MTNPSRIILLIAVLFLTSCRTDEALSPDQAAAEQIMTAAAATAEARGAQPEPDPTEEPAAPSPTTEATPAPTLTPAYRAAAIVVSENLNLRSGPGTFFPIVQGYPEGTQVTTLEMTPDGRWIRVAASGSEGWMAAAFLDLSALEAALPVVSWPEAEMITGTVLDTEGNPVSGARIAAIFNSQRAETVSTSDGNFFFYFPGDMEGPFNLEIVAINCGSTIAEVQPDGSCRASDHFPVHWQQIETLPQTQPVRFVYERGIAFLEGIVAYQDGNGASQILVRATRQSDGVQSEFVTAVGGEFRLPLGAGSWDVVAVRFLQDGTPLISETRSYQITAPGEALEYLTIPYNEIIDRN